MWRPTRATPAAPPLSTMSLPHGEKLQQCCGGRPAVYGALWRSGPRSGRRVVYSPTSPRTGRTDAIRGPQWPPLLSAPLDPHSGRSSRPCPRARVPAGCTAPRPSPSAPRPVAVDAPRRAAGRGLLSQRVSTGSPQSPRSDVTAAGFTPRRWRPAPGSSSARGRPEPAASPALHGDVGHISAAIDAERRGCQRVRVCPDEPGQSPRSAMWLPYGHIASRRGPIGRSETSATWANARR